MSFLSEYLFLLLCFVLYFFGHLYNILIPAISLSIGCLCTQEDIIQHVVTTINEDMEGPSSKGKT